MTLKHRITSVPFVSVLLPHSHFSFDAPPHLQRQFKTQSLNFLHQIQRKKKRKKNSVERPIISKPQRTTNSALPNFPFQCPCQISRGEKLQGT
ncbi:hypothetical protein DITRI_Ditri05aG0072900 [Diplodiscus trichospermus]